MEHVPNKQLSMMDSGRAEDESEYHEVYHFSHLAAETVPYEGACTSQECIRLHRSDVQSVQMSNKVQDINNVINIVAQERGITCIIKMSTVLEFTSTRPRPRFLGGSEFGF